MLQLEPGTANQLIRIVITYLFMLIMLRFAGKRRLAHLSAFDFLIIIALGSAVGDAMIYPEHVISIWNSLLAIFVVVMLQVLITKVAERSKFVDYLVRGRGTTLVKNGKVLMANMSAEDITMEELKEMLNEKGVSAISSVREAILEPSGELAVMVRHNNRGQSAMEFLMTYGWALLIMIVVIGVLFYIGMFNPQNVAPNSCTLAGGFTCYSYAIGTDGTFYLDLGQATGKTITVTGYSCSAEADPHPVDISGGVIIGQGEHAVITPSDATCVDSNGDNSTAEFYRGKLTITYTELGSTLGVGHIVKGDISAKQQAFSH